MVSPRISVMVPSIRPQTVAATIRSIDAQKFRDFELIVTTNEQCDSSLRSLLDSLASKRPQMRVLYSEGRSKSGNLNAAAVRARGSILAMTDDDCHASPTWLATIAERFEQRADVGLVAGDVIAPAAPWHRVSVCPSASLPHIIYKPDPKELGAPYGFYWLGANVAVRKDVFAMLGGFDEWLGPGTPFPACEDVDLALRAELAGVVMQTCPDVQVLHAGGRRNGRAAFGLLKGYAIGQGALAAKLSMMEHHLAASWSPYASDGSWIKHMFREPKQFCSDLYRRKHSRKGYDLFRSQFSVDRSLKSHLGFEQGSMFSLG